MSTTNHAISTKAERFAWCVYDFANSSFPTVIITALYVLYFKSTVVGSAEPGRSDNLWGAANSLGALIVFFFAPLLGAIGDLVGKKKMFLQIFTTLCIVCTAMLAFTGQGTVAMAMGLVVLAVVGFEGACVFYNAFLPDLVDEQKMGRLSGSGWALGYLGGLGCLLAVFPLATSHLKLVPLVVAGWYLLFSLPVFLVLKDRQPSQDTVSFARALSMAVARLFETVREIRKYKRLVRFLISYFFYNNAVLTIIVFAVAFASDTLRFTVGENIKLIIVMNVVAAPGAYFFGHIVDSIGAKKTLVITLVMWLFVVVGSEAAAWPGLFSEAGAKNFFWGVAGLASLGIGAVQATSRTFVGQMAPPQMSAQFYGFMAFAGKGSAILGPLVFGLASDVFDSQRVAVFTIGIFFLIGLLLLARVPPVERNLDSR